MKDLNGSVVSGAIHLNGIRLDNGTWLKAGTYELLPRAVRLHSRGTDHLGPGPDGSAGVTPFMISVASYRNPITAFPPSCSACWIMTS